MLRWMLALSVPVFVIACGSTSSPSDSSEGTVPQPVPSSLGSLTISVDTGALVVGRQLNIRVTGADASGMAFDVGNAEISSTNPSVAQLVTAVPVPISPPPGTPLYALSATFNLAAAGSTALRARLGLLSDSVVITVIPSM